VATAIPPLLPTVFTISVGISGISNQRLASKSIACLDAERILVGGKVKIAFFDKTGTLTKQGMDFLSASVHVGKGNSEMYEKPSGYLKIGMATCHSLTHTSQGLVVGNHVDKNMFLAVHGNLEQNIKDDTIRITVDGVAYSVLKRFEFDHHRMTMSVIIKDGDGHLFALVKGSGESIQSICIPSSIPFEFGKELELCAKKGIYQISMAMKTLPQEFGLDATLSLVNRDDLERDLTFVAKRQLM
jgi:magnesium-transporting ATPase (P-type)